MNSDNNENNENDNNDLVEDEKYEKYDENFSAYSKSFFLTYPQCPLDEITFYYEFKKLILFKANQEIRSCICCSEDHKTSEGKHIHIYFELYRRIKIRTNDYFNLTYENIMYHPNIQVPKDKVGVIKYIAGLTKKKKDDIKHIYQVGIDYKIYLKKRKNHKKNLCKQLIEKKISLIDAVLQEPLFIQNYRTLKLNLQNYWADSSDNKFEGRTCYWVWGSPGIGKSYCIRNMYPNVFLKSSNKWWDGYVDQDIVLIDDFDMKDLSHYIKIWADSFIFIGEVKGGTVMCKYKILFITSNYTIKQIFFDPLDVNSILLCKAIERRFIVIDADKNINNNGFFNFPNELIK